MPFQWTLNPYRGCEFGCTYCYARHSHEFLGMEEWLDFQEKILVKRSAPAGFLPRLEKDFPALASRYRREYSRSAYQSQRVRERLSRLVSELKLKHRLGVAQQESFHPGNREAARTADPVLQDDLLLR